MRVAWVHAHPANPYPGRHAMPWGPLAPCSSSPRDGTTQHHVLHFLHLDSSAPPPLLFLNAHSNRAKLDPPPHRVPGPRTRSSARAERHRSVHSPRPCVGSPIEAMPRRSCLGCHAAPHRAERQRTHAPHLAGAHLGRASGARLAMSLAPPSSTVLAPCCYRVQPSMRRAHDGDAASAPTSSSHMGPLPPSAWSICPRRCPGEKHHATSSAAHRDTPLHHSLYARGLRCTRHQAEGTPHHDWELRVVVVLKSEITSAFTFSPSSREPRCIRLLIVIAVYPHLLPYLPPFTLAHSPHRRLAARRSLHAARACRTPSTHIIKLLCFNLLYELVNSCLVVNQ
jgi:hypothetical protein